MKNLKTNLLWTPSCDRIKDSQIQSFINHLNQKLSLSIENYTQLYRFSIHDQTRFWSELWDFISIMGEKGGVVCTDFFSFKNARWFPEAKLNYAENSLKNRTDQFAIIFNVEYQIQKNITYNELYADVSKMVQFLKHIGIKKNDRIAILANNAPQTVICVLAISAIGAISSLCSTDFGVGGIIERFAQIEPALLIYFDFAIYNGKMFPQIEKISTVIAHLPSVQNILKIPYLDIQSNHPSTLPNEHVFDEVLKIYPAKEIEFEKVPFSHPLYIMYSSGTTGKPKCIVHGHGGVLLQHKKEHILHCDIKPHDRVFFYTTCGWMMWQWLISALSSDATIILYDGSPFYPNPEALLHYLEQNDVALFGTSAKYIDNLRQLKLDIQNKFIFKKLKIICSTGSPLNGENFEFVYNHWKQDVQLSSMSGGTDILSCFVLGCPILPVFKGEIQCIGLGLQVAIYDDTGSPLPLCEAGELVCEAPFPSTPVCFWSDHDGILYYKSYFSRFDNKWCHGDWACITTSHGVIIYGRSDTTLNPGGVRIGTAEIYNQVEKINNILESVVTEYDDKGHLHIVLFVKLKHNIHLDTEMVDLIKNKIRMNCSPRHVPTFIYEVPDIPKTRSGKIMELAVKNAINRREIKNIESIQNPESLQIFEKFYKLYQSTHQLSDDVKLGVHQCL